MKNFSNSILVFGLLALAASAAEVVPEEQVLRAQAERIAVVQKISEPTLAIIDTAGQGLGSGVVISADGYALTNFHVASPCGPAMKCGMTNGQLYDAVIVGMDPTGKSKKLEELNKYAPWLSLSRPSTDASEVLSKSWKLPSALE